MAYIHKLRERLVRANIPVHTWGLPGTATKSLEELDRELRETSSFIPPEGPVICYRHSVCIENQYIAAGGKLLILYEDEIEHPDGSIQKRNLPYIRGSWRHGEPIKVTVQNEILEEKGCLVPLDLIFEATQPPKRIDPKLYISKTFPGLPTRRTEEHVSALFSRYQFRSRGYEKNERGYITRTKWHSLVRKNEKPPAR